MPQNNTKIFNQLEAASNRKKLIYRWILYLILGVFVVYYVTPLYVMIVTSFKTMTEIRQGNLFSFPEALRLGAWKEAWIGQDIDAEVEPHPRGIAANRSWANDYRCEFRRLILE